jgi:Cu(I)/Ag(I) efflux system membrane fusion protein
MKRILIVVVVMAALAAAFFAGRKFASRPSGPATAETPAAGAKKQLYQCSMHPQIISDKPGTCPICGMNLEPVEEAPAAQPSAEPGEVAGHAGFTLSTERQQLIGVTRGKVETRDLKLVIRTVGRVAYDPELYRAIVEYRDVLNRPGMETVVSSAALRLRQLGLSEEMIKELADPGHDPQRLLLPGKEVWVYAQIYEYEVDLVRSGQAVEITTPSLPGRAYTAKVVAVDPILNAATRTVRARILVETPDESLRPEMFVHVKLEIPLGKKLAVPFDAVLDTGENQLVFVVKGAGTFEPRSVKLGRQADSYYEVISGLEAGEEVVTSANFLIDSESRFRSAVAAFKKAPPAAHQH